MQGDEKQAKLIVVMGVSGSGKSTIGRQLAVKLGYRFVEADDFHSAAAIEHMTKGLPLDDTMRQPWITRLCQHLAQPPQDNTVLAYSGLRRQHRQRFRDLGFKSLFILLHTTPDILSQRMQSRMDHFMPAALLTSQIEALQLPDSEADMLIIDTGSNQQQVFEDALAAAGLII